MPILGITSDSSDLLSSFARISFQLYGLKQIFFHSPREMNERRGKKKERNPTKLIKHANARATNGSAVALRGNQMKLMQCAFLSFIFDFPLWSAFILMPFPCYCCCCGCCCCSGFLNVFFFFFDIISNSAHSFHSFIQLFLSSSIIHFYFTVRLFVSWNRISEQRTLDTNK